MDALKDDNERLRRRKDELEMLFEHSNVKDAYNIPKYKVRFDLLSVRWCMAQ